jgi:FKBP-type peptidyl-prolyl cis-trans isomerase
MRKIAIVILGCLLFASCGNKYKGFKRTGNGLYYRFHVENATRHVPENDDIIFLEMSIRTEKDSVVVPPKQIPVMMQASRFKGDIYEALSLMHEGDSAEFIINAKKYFEVYNYGQIPDFVKNDEMMLWFTIRIDAIESREQYQMKLVENRLEAEKQSIADYLTANNLTATPQPSGLYYIETKEGKGKNPANGKKVWVHYTGRLLDGTVFDSSIERGDPLPFQLGVGQVIKGWDEGIALMKKGGKALLVIPSQLAYGEKGAGGSIPPYSPLIFEVELVDME